MARNVRACVVYGFGLNCDRETQHAFKMAGADAYRVHLTDVINSPEVLKQYDILAVPGGFSHGDEISAGKVLAVKMKQGLGEFMYNFIEDGKPLIGICNGYQAFVKGGFLPDLNGQREQEVTLTYNESGRFVDTWVDLKVYSNKCPFTRGMDRLELPVRHGEGKFDAPPETVAELNARDMVVLRYAPKDGDYSMPYNPNGSLDDIAAICNERGNVMGIMPHPEGFMFSEQHPLWTRKRKEPIGLQIFRNAVEYVKENL